MKKYTFRLEAVLKVRKLKEENCRMELGVLMSHLTKIDDQLSYERKAIQDYYSVQEGAMKTGMRGDQIQAFPMLVSAKEKNIQLLLRDRQKQEDLITDKKSELATLRGELKVIDNLKEKDYTEYRKALSKEIDQKVEEQTQNWLNHKDRKF